ncbi:MAG: glycerophosphodiester phosphodiesterase [Pseudoalteromonas sp.]|nr:glycerophosphodiester phosphodiesterase [Pseudoalteromonas sp.]
MKRFVGFIPILFAGCSSTLTVQSDEDIQVGVRPYYLVEQLAESELKTRLSTCKPKAFKKSDFSIGHRGAPLQFPEHTKESYMAAAKMGAGILECDVAFTKDKALVCRHSQCDLHTTTNILAIPELAKKCRVPFQGGDADQGVKAKVECCTSDITLDEFLQLKGKMDGANEFARTKQAYMQGTPNWRTDLYAANGTVMTHKQSIELFKQLGVKMTPELKTPQVEIPFNGFTQQAYATKLISEYEQAGVPAKDVFPQSFLLSDVQYWLKNHSDYAQQAVYLDDSYEIAGFDHNDPSTWQHTMAELKAMGVNIIAPPLWMLVTTSEKGELAQSAYATEAKKAGLKIITWSLERSGPLTNGGGFYYQSVKDLVKNDGFTLELLDFLAQEIGVIGLFSDWPATTTFYANCMN